MILIQEILNVKKIEGTFVIGKSKKTRYDIEYLDERLKILMFKKDYERHPELLKELKKISPITNEFKSWTPLKLIGLSYFIGSYLDILAGMEKKHGPVELIYIDPFCGCGLNAVNEEILAGSPIITINCASKVERKFDRLFFGDLNEGYTDALKKRLQYIESLWNYDWIKDKYTIQTADANIFLNKVVDELEKFQYKNYLAFIDPYFTSLSWESLERLLKIPYGDLIYTLQSKLIAKEVCKNTSEQMFHNQEKIDEYSRFFDLPPEEWIKLRTEKEVKQHFIKKIEQYKKFVLDIEISHEGYYYYLIFATRNQNPSWAPIIRRLKKIIETYDGNAVQYSLDFISGKLPKGKTPRLSTFWQ